MATQWTAGLTDNTVLPASTLNRIGAAWETWTPTMGASAGTITSGTLIRARYAQIQKIVFARLEYSITTAGTAAGAALTFTLPILPATYEVGGAIGSGREYISVGFQLEAMWISGTSGRISDYNNAGWIQNNRGANVFLMYEAA